MLKRLIWLLPALFLLNACHVARFFYFNFADVRDHKKFPKRVLTKSITPFVYPTKACRFPDTILYNKQKINPEKFLEDNHTLAFLVIRNDSIIYENYFRGRNKESIVPSFSVAKSFSSALIGCALQDGLISSVDEPITNYIPELKKNGFEKVKIKHVLQMTTGIRFTEGYFNPFSDVAELYYGRKLEKQMLKLKLEKEPGTEFAYKSGNSQLLGLILHRALKGKSITQYLQEKIWTPAGMESDASWSIDRKNGLEKTFCCLNATARDFAKIGSVYLNQGWFNGQQIISKEWVQQTLRPNNTEGSVDYYNHQWWFPCQDQKCYLAQGILGQYVFVYPAKKIVIVRLSKKDNKVSWTRFFQGLINKL